MAINGKYNLEEKKIVTKIYRLKAKQRLTFNYWQLLDIKIISLKQKLNGKYA